MHIIPVIDLLNGSVVHAKKGERSRYHPITSSLTKSTSPLDIVKALMDVYPFKTLYIADLNAIQNLVNIDIAHNKITEQIKLAFPNLTLWIDAGIRSIESVAKGNTSQTQIILGSESFSKIEQYQAFTATLNTPHILSLDFTKQGFKGPNALIQDSQHWPNHIIVMTLAKVGANAGADMKTIKEIITKKREHAIYAAGGIRNLQDILQLKKLGVDGCLLASALHNKQITTQELNSFNT